MNWDLFRDACHLCEFDFDRYFYVAEKVPPSYFISTLKKMWGLINDIHQIHGTEKFLIQNYMAGFMPVSFRGPAASTSKSLRMAEPAGISTASL
jgi:hypothetical protein